MKIGTEVKVVTSIYGHEFNDDEIVKRYPLEYDNDHKELVGFINSKGVSWYMAPDEYEVVNENS